MMDDGEVDSLNSCGSLDDYSHFLENSSIIQSDWETFIGICSHKHICNPTTGPDNTHTHTCEHTHTQTIGSEDDEEKLTKKRRPSGNKEAVRKYREKQKAVKVNLVVRNAELEKENQIIPELQRENLRLRRKLLEQGPKQDALAHLILENKRLRSLLSQLRREIDSELDDGVNYNTKFVLNGGATKVVRSSAPSSGVHAPAGCAAPVPCFLPARPGATGAAAHVASTGLSELDGADSLGWHAECELRNSSKVCHSPEFDDGDTRDKCASFGSLPSSVSRKERVTIVSSSKAATVATTSKRGRNNAILQTVPVASRLAGAACKASVPCFNRDPTSAVTAEASQPGGELNMTASRWQAVGGGNCEHLVSETSLNIDVTADLSPQSVSLSPQEDVTRSVSNTACSSKLGRIDGTADIFSQTCFYQDGPPGIVPPQPPSSCWNHRSPTAPDSDGCWLENCGNVD